MDNQKEKFPESAPSGRDSPEGEDAGAQKTPRKRGSPSVGRALALFLLKLFLVGGAVYVLLTWVGGVTICHSNDMYPALRDGDLVITFRLGEYANGDIALYRGGGQTRFGRIVGGPGDEIFLGESGAFTVNGLAPYETIFYETTAREGQSVTYPCTLREGEYFLLADSRENGLDSRDFGPAKKLLGKVVLVVRRRGF